MKMKCLLVLTVVFVMSSFVFAQSPAGKWTGEMPGGGATTPVAFEFTVAGTTLTGTITVGAGMPTPITAGTIMGDTITFQAPAGGGRGGGQGAGGGGGGRGGGGGGLATYTGKVTASEIAFSRVAGGGGGGRGGGGGGAQGGGAPPAAGAPPAGGAAPAAPAPVTFTVKKAS
jgi:hypothetical protein